MKKIGNYIENMFLFGKNIIWKKLVNEYVNYLQSDIAASTKFWKMKSRIYEDAKKPGVILKMSRSTMSYNLVLLIKDNVITFDDLNVFSSDTINEVKLYLH